MNSAAKTRIFVQIKNIYSILPRKRKSTLNLVLFLMIASGFLEIFNIAALIPFLTVISEPERVLEIQYYSKIAIFFNIRDIQELRFFFSLVFIFVVVASSSIRIFSTWKFSRFSSDVCSDLSCEYFKSIISRPYIYHLKKNSSEFLASLTAYIEGLQNFMFSFFQVSSAFFVAIFLCLSLVFVNWGIAIFSIIFFGSLYFLIAFLIKKRLKRNSKLLVELADIQVQKIQECSGSIKEIIINNLQNTFLNIYKKADLPLRLKRGEAIFLAGFPRYLVEAIGLVFIAIIAYILSIDENLNIGLIPTLGVLALAAQRLLPACQTIYSGWANMYYYHDSVEALTSEIQTNLFEKPFNYFAKNDSFRFKESINLKNISFIYPGTKKVVLKKINLKIKKGEFIGIFGSSGSGKSTLLNIMLGLIKPTSGEILIDNKSLNDENVFYLWKSILSFVPQNIFLSDSSLINNIAFGVSKKAINYSKLRKATEMACLENFIKESSDGLNKIVGERGKRISGGQLQRIGIARAFYRNKEIIFFDEATSALDIKTERKVMEKIKKQNKDKTIIIVAHRLQTLTNCDRIIEIDDGLIKNVFTNKEFIENLNKNIF